MIIKNWLTGSFACIATLIALVTLGWPAILYHLLFALAVGFVTYVAFHFNQMGGGDLKLLVGIAIALGMWRFFDFVFILAVATLVVLVLHRIIGNFVRPHDPDRKLASFHRQRQFPLRITIGLAYLFFIVRAVIQTV